MRQRVDGSHLIARAIAGTHVVTLAWDLVDRSAVDGDDLMGFAIERSRLAPDGTSAGTHWLTGIKRFRDKDPELEAGTPVPTSRHPIQSFQWADYTAEPGRKYEYRVMPVRGTPEDCAPVEPEATVVAVATERPASAPGEGEPRHDVFFNRGVAGSQGYARLFPDAAPDQDRPDSDQMKWLSRGLFEALTDFIGRAAGEDAGDYGLRAMLYEFRYGPVGLAFRRAADAGADVDIRYEAQTYREDNEDMIGGAGIGDLCSPQRSRAGIRHNKFIVLLHHGEPIAVWTGSTNISPGGIFGHSNVGHVVHDREVARRYLEYWGRLAADDVTAAPLRAANVAAEPTPAPGEAPPAGRIMTLFSPRDPKDPGTTSPTLAWYAGLLRSATRLACMTVAFNFDPVFQEALRGEADALSYLVFDKAMEQQRETEVRRNRNTVLAVGGMLEEDDFELFLGERLTGFNRNRYIHDKFLLVDPLSDDPIVVTGSANFSEPSQETNDENMLVIRGNTRVADIYFGEFMRIFDHHYSRYIVGRMRDEGSHDPDAGFLKRKTSDWAPGHFRSGLKSKRRRVFVDAA